MISSNLNFLNTGFYFSTSFSLNIFPDISDRQHPYFCYICVVTVFMMFSSLNTRMFFYSEKDLGVLKRQREEQTLKNQDRQRNRKSAKL